jgi:hypothetical protein
MTTRADVLDVIYKSIEAKVSFDKGVFAKFYTEWDVLPLEENGELIGGVLAKGNELHVGYARQPRATIRPYIRAILGKTLEEHGVVLTSVEPGNTVGLRFCERLGFVKYDEINGVSLLKCSRSNYL